MTIKELQENCAILREDRAKELTDKEVSETIETATELGLHIELGTVTMPPSGCENCDGGRIEIPIPGGLNYQTTFCHCYFRRETISRMLSEYQNTRMSREMITKYNLTGYAEDEITKSELCKIVHSKSGGLFLTGDIGGGKTYTSIVGLQLALAMGKSAYGISVVSLASSLRPNSVVDSAEIMQRCIDVDVLLLDDLGKEKGSEWVGQVLFQIIDERYANNKKTIITSNYPLEELEKRLGEIGGAIIDRIKEKVKIVEFDGGSKRD